MSWPFGMDKELCCPIGGIPLEGRDAVSMLEISEVVMVMHGRTDQFHRYRSSGRHIQLLYNQQQTESWISREAFRPTSLEENDHQ